MSALRTDPLDTRGHAEAAAYRAEKEDEAREAFRELVAFVDRRPNGTDTRRDFYLTLCDSVSDYLPLDATFFASDDSAHEINLSHRRIAEAVWDAAHPLPVRIRDFRGIASEIATRIGGV